MTEENGMRVEERTVRWRARELGLKVRGGDGAFVLERNDASSFKAPKCAKKRIGSYRSIATLGRGVKRYRDMILREVKKDGLFFCNDCPRTVLETGDWYM